MGLYEDRLASLSEPRLSRRAAQRKPTPRKPSSAVASSASRSSKHVQSLLFERSEGWTVNAAKQWARARGYSAGSVDTTDRHIRVRQFDSQGLQVKNTVPFGRGIRAVVAREGKSMAVVKARRTRKKKKSPSRKKSAGRRRRTSKGQFTRGKRRRKVKSNVVQAAKRRRRRKVSEAPVMAAPRRRRRSTRRRAKRTVRAWRGNAAGHATAARKGWRRRKAKRAGPKRRRGGKRKSRRVSELASAVVAAPRRRRRRSGRGRRRMHASTRRRSSTMRAKTLFEGRRGSLGAIEVGIALLSGGLGFVLADGLDRFLATYDPAGTRPTNKFTSDGAGTLANTLNVAARPGWQRVAAGVGATALPVLGSLYVKSPKARAAAQGLAIGAGASLFKTIWQNVVVPLLLGKNTTTPALQQNVIARLYPAEVAASINLKASQLAVNSAGSGALSDQLGVGDVGPFAGLAGDSPYPDAAQALRRDAGIIADQYPSQQNIWGTGGPGSDYPTAQQALQAAAGRVGDAPWFPGPGSDIGPGPQNTGKSSCGCVGEKAGYFGIVGTGEAPPTGNMMFNLGD